MKTQEIDIMSHREDFTTSHYRELLQQAKSKYKFIAYNEIDFTEPFVLWRHDCDFSLNRCLRLAEIEKEEGVHSTFFVNPHSEFYNIFEKKQYELLVQIKEMGHKLALHFDSAFYDVSSESQLDDLVKKDAYTLENLFDVEIDTFSFHNPTEFLLSCKKPTYGGLINCYAEQFSSKIGYCSDSNGYWRFRRLHDVLVNAEDEFLQVLTHCGWWQEDVMSARDCIVRCAEGRKDAILNDYDSFLEANNRVNLR